MAVHSLRCRAVHKHAYVFVCGGEGEVLGEIRIEDEAVDGVKLIKIISCFPNHSPIQCLHRTIKWVIDKLPKGMCVCEHPEVVPNNK